MPYYIDGPYTNTKTVTHPLLTSTEYPGNCTLTCSITYDYYRTYAGVSVSGIYIGIAGGEIRNVTTRFTNNTNGTFYLLWQNQGTRAFYTSSDIDPIMQPQRNIYMQFLGQIVGQTQFFGLPEDTPKPINSSAVISVMP
ncbi:MAG: hypothetical protein J6K74_01180 [Marinifilaceae bacterium]|nr:hypothetical protein [Marinifilaceae bacterium]